MIPHHRIFAAVATTLCLASCANLTPEQQVRRTARMAALSSAVATVGAAAFTIALNGLASAAVNNLENRKRTP